MRDGPLLSTIRGAIRIPECQITTRMSELSRDKLIVLYSWDAECDLAIKATIQLEGAGFGARQLHGGVAAWSLLKLPLIYRAL